MTGGIAFAAGTPLSNSMTEIYTQICVISSMVRYRN